jgi:hypothetical protein
MWEELKVYRPLDKGAINPTFKKFGQELKQKLVDYSIDQTNSIIKLSRLKNNIEQGVFIEKHIAPNKLEVKICLKPADFYKKHRYTMVNIVPLGDILSNYRRSFYPLTEEWRDLVTYLSDRIRNEVEEYFNKYDTYEKIIKGRNEIEPKDFGLDNKYELLIYGAIKTRNSELLEKYLTQKLERPTMQITKTEFLKPDTKEVNETDLLKKILDYGKQKKFEDIEGLLKSFK